MTKQAQREMLAKLTAGCAVTRVEAGVAALPDMTPRDWARVVRTPRDENALIAERHVTYGHGDRVYVTNGLGERIA